MTYRSYLELRELDTFEDRYAYLALDGIVGDPTFGAERYLNQRFYTSSAWRSVRNRVIVRDEGRDLGVSGREIYGSLYIHHINPLTADDIKFGRPCLVDPDNLITVCHQTHNAIHYGDENQLPKEFVERQAGDTKDW